MPVRFAGLPSRTAARTAATHGQTSSRSHGRHRNGAPPQQLEDRRRTTDATPATIHSTPDRGLERERSRRPARRSRTRRSTVVSRLWLAEVEGEERRSANRMTRADARVPRRAPGREALAARRDDGAGRGGHIGAVGWCGATASVAGSIDLDPPDRPDQVRRGDEHDDQRHDEHEEVERDPGLDAHRLAARRQRPEQERGDDDAARAEARQQGEGDRGEPDPAGQVERELADRADDQERPGQAGQRARQGHRQHHRAAGAHPGVARGRQVEPGGPQLEALGRPEQEERHRHRHEQRDRRTRSRGGSPAGR